MSSNKRQEMSGAAHRKQRKERNTENQRNKRFCVNESKKEEFFKIGVIIIYIVTYTPPLILVK